MEKKHLWEHMHVKAPETFIGLWVITQEYGTHGAIDVVRPGKDGYEFYHSKEDAIEMLVQELRHSYPNITVENFHSYERPFDTRQVMQVTKDYPYLQLTLRTCNIFK